MESNLRPIPAVKPVAPYLGGKRLLATRIVERLRDIPHTSYVEPFVGMGGVFFRRPFRPKAEIINDLNGDVANLFRILQRHYVALMDELRWSVTSRAEFERLRAAVPDTLTDIERAIRFLYLQRLAFGGKSKNQAFGMSVRTPARFDLTKLVPLLEDVHERLSDVTIEALPWQDIIRRYDRPDTMFYMDPPYWGAENYYNAPFSRDQYEEMAEILSGISGRVILSLNDRAEVRETFRRFDIEAVSVRYTISSHTHGCGEKGELLISN